MRRIILLIGLLVGVVGSVQAEHGAELNRVVLVGDFSAELAFNPTHQLWLTTLDIAAGDYTYAIEADGEPFDGPPLSLDTDSEVTFLYSPRTHYVADSVNHIFANVPGSFNAAIGCPDTSFDDSGAPGNWAPDCWQTLLEDPDGDGIYHYVTTAIPVGDYEAKVAVGGSWSENYGDGGAAGGANLGFSVTKPDAEVVFEWDSESKVMKIIAAGAPKGNLKELAAYWVAPDTILTREEAVFRYQLHFSADAALQVGESGISGGETFDLTIADDFDPVIKRKFPHLSQLTALTVPAEAVERIDDLLRGQVAISVADPGGNPVTATGLQLPSVLDALYANNEPLGSTFEANGDITLRVWAPTAQAVRFRGSTNDAIASSHAGGSVAGQVLEMTRDDDTGVWSLTLDSSWLGGYYLYEVDVYAHSEGAIVTNLITDPYSVSLLSNSLASHLIDLSATAKPDGWSTLEKPALAAFEDITLYELHVRDFSIIDETVPEAERGTFKAFTHQGSNGMTHLRALADAGLSHVHLLPVFDIATINENRDEQSAVLDRYLAGFDSAEFQQQQAIFNIRDKDGFNWGYDPFHYTVPEGSYSTNPDDTSRILEFREMVQSLNKSGLRVVMDVVYNHTNASGQAEKSVLDQIVPGYYHRLNSKGKVENSTCCANTATEHDMMRKLMVDSVVTWATEYKVDGFRFDLMGHHMKADMQAVRDALDTLTLAEHGVNGKAIYIYGEGWNFGEVASGQRGVNATQLAVGGMGIGTFNDRIRDAARGGNPFGGEQEQGFATGLLTNPNGTQAESNASINLAKFGDQIRVGLTGNLAEYTLINNRGDEVTGQFVDYNGAPTGYTDDPQEVINYVSAHDNETLFDAIQYKLPQDADMATRVAHQNFALDLVMLGQGVPFFHAGSDMLRSKSLDRDSYNSGDWFNAIDWTYNENNWGKGLPVADKNESKWPIMQPLLADPTLKPTQADILANAQHFRTMLQVRQSSPLFRLRTAEQIASRVQFHNMGPSQVPGLIVMSIDDSGTERIDPNFDQIVVLFNGRADAVEFSVEGLAGAELFLHPTLAASSMSTWLNASYADGTFSVPPVTTAVFVQAGDATVELTDEFGVTSLGEIEVDEEENSAEISATEANDSAETETSVESNDQIGATSGLLLGVALPLIITFLVILFGAVALGIVGVWALTNDD